MRKRYSLWLLIPMMLLLIFDTKTAISGASSGLEMCIKSVIPSLFPFMFLSSLLAGAIGNHINALGPIRHLCQIPDGCDGILILGLLGGYPVGARLIAQQYESGNISKEAAHRLMGFCNNSGPAFIFGMLWNAFSIKWALWFLWGVQILSAVITGMLLPKVKYEITSQCQDKSLNVVETLNHCVRATGSICGWILMFRVLIAYLDQWVFPNFSNVLQVVCAGILELVNGCHLLSTVQSEGLRFVLCAGMLSFGGTCVLMQTASVASRSGIGMYLPGKLLQTTIAIFLSLICQYLLFSDHILNVYPLILIIIPLGFIYFLLTKKTVAFL